MPELLEVEAYRQLAEAALGRTVTAVDAPDDWFLKGGLTAEVLADATVGGTIVTTRRRGKLLVLDLDDDRPSVGLRFGMTGRLILDGAAGVDRLEYSSNQDQPAWDRVRFTLDGSGHLVVRDPRRLGGVELDPDEEALGPDAASLGLRQLRPILASSGAAVKAVLMDQSRLAGLGNLMTDEVLWFAGVDPARPARSLADEEVTRVHRAIRRTVDLLGRRGGSHTGDTFDQRQAGGACPRCGTPLVRSTVGGRTTWACPSHQR